MKQTFLLLLSLASFIATAQIDQNLTAHYTFDGNYDDASGNGYNGYH